MKIKTGFKKSFSTVIARSGAGKTLLCDLLLKAQSKPVIVVDTFDQFEHDLSLDFTELVQYFNNNDAMESFYKYKKTIVLRLGDTKLDSFFGLIMKSNKFHDLLIFVDEIDMNFEKSTTHNKDAFYQLINRGRHKNFDLLTTCRNTANIPKQLIGQTDFFYFSDLIEDGALTFVNKTLKGLNISDTISNLEQYQFLKVDVNKKELFTFKTDIKWLDYFN